MAKHYEASAAIEAPPEAIWAILTDGPGYASWDSGVIEVEGTIALGEKIKVRSEVDPKRSFPLRVTELTADRRMAWAGGMPLGLFRGVRTFTLTPSAGTTEFHVREELTGPLLGLIGRSMPGLQPSFDQFAAGLKARAESA